MTLEDQDTTFPFSTDIAYQAGDIVFATDRQGRIVYWNGEAEALSGYTAEEVLGKPYTLACRMEPDVDVVDLAAVLAGHDFAGGVRCHLRNGGDAVLYLFATVGRDGAGEPTGVLFVGRDVTGLWRAAEAAQASTDKYRLLFENMVDSVAIADMDGRVLEANPACLRLYGYAAGDVKQMNLADVVAPEDRGAAARAIARLAAGRTVARTIRLVRKDGTRFVAELAASVIAINGQRRIMAVTRDVTERVRAEEARSQSERMYRAVFEAANDAVFVESVDGHILDVNQNGCKLLGYRRDELLRMSVSDLVPAEARAWLSMVSDTILRERTFRTEAVNVHKGGRHVPVEVSASPMEVDGGTVVLAIVRDIAERKQAEQVLRESEEKFRSVSEQSPNMIFINRRGRVVYANLKSAEVMGYTREEFYAPGFDFMNLVAPESAEQIKTVYARHARGEEVEPYEYTLVTRDGRGIEAIITTKLIDYQGTKAILGIVTDVTERVEADRALRESERQYRTALEAMRDPVHVADADLRIVMVNQALVRWLRENGIADAVLGKTVFEAFPFLPDRVREEYRQVFAAGQPVVTEEETEVDGHTVITETNKMPVTEQGRVVRVMTVIRDVTERRRLARVAQETADELRAVLDNSPGAIAGECEGVLVYANQRFARLFGYGSPAEVIGRPAGDFDAPQDRELLARYSRMREQGKDVPNSYSFHGLRRDGTTVPLEATISTYRSLGRLHILAIIREPAPGR